MQKNAKLNQDLDASSFLTIDVFEKIIIFLEKHTGFAVDPIPLLHAERQLGDKFKWPPAVTHRIMAEVYSYWMDKRRRSGKALCRKYWPQTPVSDTNPHHVFRYNSILID